MYFPDWLLMRMVELECKRVDWVEMGCELGVEGREPEPSLLADWDVGVESGIDS